MNKKAFTLIELLVTIVIIGLLAGLLIPVMGRAREGARRAMCANNLRQHGVAWYLYLDDHDECFPFLANFIFGGKKANGTPLSDAQSRVLNRYLDVDNTSSAEIFYCPDDTKPNLAASNQTSFDWYGNSYNGSRLILFEYGTTVRLSTITTPHDRLYLEICNLWNSPGHSGRGIIAKTPVMVLFVDGHVAGPFLYSDDFDLMHNDPNKKVLYWIN